MVDDVHADHVAVEEVCDEAPHGLLRCNEHEGCLLQRTHRLQRQIALHLPVREFNVCWEWGVGRLLWIS